MKMEMYTPIPNLLLEGIIKTKLSGTEISVILAVVRKTYGWHKTSDYISASQISSMTGLPKPYVFRLIKRLVSKKILTKVGGNRKVPNKLSIEILEEWEINTRDILQDTTSLNASDSADNSTSNLEDTLSNNPEDIDKINNKMKEIRDLYLFLRKK